MASDICSIIARATDNMLDVTPRQAEELLLKALREIRELRAELAAVDAQAQREN